MFMSLGVVGLAWLLGQGAPVAAPSDLAVVKAFYAAASYEDALSHLAKVDPAVTSPEIEQYRALCLVALARTTEAQQAFDRLVHIAPLYVVPESEVSPRVVAMFRDARRRVLPTAVRALYAKGKASFDEQRYATAVTELRELLSVLGDPDMASQAEAFADLRQLAEGFLSLSDLRLKAAERAAAPAVVAPPAPPAPIATAPAVPAAEAITVTKIVIYTRDDAGVTPPVDLQRFMPPWNPPAIIARSVEYRGEIEVIVDESGRVEQATMLRPSFPPYDVTLLAVARRWRFEPARRDGQPVKFRLSFEIALSPRR